MRSRSRKFIRVDVQLRVVLAALSVAGIVLFINFCLVILCINGALDRVGAGGSTNSVVEAVRFAVAKQFLLCIGISIPVAAAVGILYSFRFAGPIYRFSKYFKDLETQRWDQRCTLRKGDDLQDICTGINSSLDGLRAALRESRDLCGEVNSRLASGELTSSEANSASLAALRHRLASLESSIAQRLPSDPHASANEAVQIPQLQA